jgi:hypothetical protein
MGIKSTNMMKNLGTYLFAFVGLIVVMITLFLLRFLMLKYTLTTKIYNAIYAKLFFNSVLRSFLTSYLTMSISTFISLKNLEFGEVSDIISSVLSIITIILITIAPILSFIFLQMKKDKLENQLFKPKYNSLYLNLNSWDARARLVSSLFMIRRLILAISINFF